MFDHLNTTCMISTPGNSHPDSCSMKPLICDSGGRHRNMWDRLPKVEISYRVSSCSFIIFRTVFLANRWFSNIHCNEVREMTEASLITTISSGRMNSLSMDDLGGIFVIFLSALVSSVLVSTVEYYQHRKQKAITLRFHEEVLFFEAQLFAIGVPYKSIEFDNDS